MRSPDAADYRHYTRDARARQAAGTGTLKAPPIPAGDSDIVDSNQLKNTGECHALFIRLGFAPLA
jgi:hypothetical protein